MAIDRDDREIIKDIAKLQAQEVMRSYHSEVMQSIQVLKGDIITLLDTKLEPIESEVMRVRENYHKINNSIQPLMAKASLNGNGNGNGKKLNPIYDLWYNYPKVRYLILGFIGMMCGAGIMQFMSAVTGKDIFNIIKIIQVFI